MSSFLSIILLMAVTNSFVIFDFNKKSDLSNWYVVDDGVMGGRSVGEFYLSTNGDGFFYGNISLENNGGFSSVRYPFEKTNIQAYSKFVLRVKGDGKQYQFRAKTNSTDYYSYITYISTSEDWQTIEIPFNELYPSFRGRKLNQANFAGESIEEIGFLFGNKKAESFHLEIDKIEIK